jgi:heterodisulfide reductase subunit C2
METATQIETRHAPESEAMAKSVAAIQEMVRACMQCGTCSASCPNAPDMDYTPRQMWRLLLTGFVDEVLESRTFKLCSSCYTCTLRCPRGLSLTDAVHALKQLAAARERTTRKGSDTLFYRLFMDNVRRYGRVQETKLMFDYFLGKRDPRLPLAYTPLGLRMLAKGKLHAPSGRHKGSLEALYRQVGAMEGW